MLHGYLAETEGLQVQVREGRRRACSAQGYRESLRTGGGKAEEREKAREGTGILLVSEQLNDPGEFRELMQQRETMTSSQVFSRCIGGSRSTANGPGR